MKRFVDEQELNFSLLSDPDGSAGTKYGALPKGAKWTSRVTFIIDDKGIVRHIDNNVNVQNHGMDLAELVVQLQE